MRIAIISTALVGIFSSALAAPDAKAGKAIYTANCVGCHGNVGQGKVGPVLAGEVAGWKAALFKWAMLQSLDDKGVMLKSPMPVWGKIGFNHTGKAPTDAQITNLQAYLKTFKAK